MSRIRALKCVVFLLLLVPTFPAGAQDRGQATFPGVFDAVAYVRIDGMEDSLRASDVRRVEHGAPPPLVPYKARLSVQRTCPNVNLYRLILEGLIAGTWLPEEDTTGILLVAQSGKDYVPAGAFPIEVYLPEQEVDGVRKIEFPPKSGILVPFDQAWDCLCDIQAMGTGPAGAEVLEKYRGLYLSDTVDSQAVGLFFLLKSPGNNVPWDALAERLSAAGDSPKSLPPEKVLNLLADYASAENAGPALQTVLAVLPGHGRQPEGESLADVCLLLALRGGGTDQAQMLETVLTREWDGPRGREALVGEFVPVAPVLENLKGESNELLLGRMLREPTRFPALRKAADLGTFWKLLELRKHAGLPGYLRSFLQQPSPSFLGISAEPDELSYLSRLAKDIVKSWNASEAP